MRELIGRVSQAAGSQLAGGHGWAAWATATTWELRGGAASSYSVSGGARNPVFTCTLSVSECRQQKTPRARAGHTECICSLWSVWAVCFYTSLPAGFTPRSRVTLRERALSFSIYFSNTFNMLEHWKKYAKRTYFLYCSKKKNYIYITYPADFLRSWFIWGMKKGGREKKITLEALGSFWKIQSISFTL